MAFFSSGYYRKNIFLLLFLIFMGQVVQGQVRKNFITRTPTSAPDRKVFNIKGDFSMLGNTNLTLRDYSDNLENNQEMIFVDIDGDPNTVNSSSATLQFSSENNASSECTEVLFAGLYWSGRSHNNMTYTVRHNGQDKRLDKREVKIKGPQESEYITLRANENDIYFPGSLQQDLGMFVGFVEITDYVKRNGEGEYTVADLATITGTNYFYGGWGMVVVYENYKMNHRDITVFDGYALMNYTTNLVYDFQVSGFSAISDGPVNVKMGIMAGEGDRPVSGDYLEIEKGINTGNFVRLSHGNNDPNNFFNASIFTGGNARNPSLLNNSGTDLAVFQLPNANNEIIGNNQTSTRFRYGTDYDNYVIYNMTFAIDANQLEIAPINVLESINGTMADEVVPTVAPGDMLKFLLTIKNHGEVDVENGKAVIPLPRGVSFVPGSENKTFNFVGSGYSDAYFDPALGENGALVIVFGNLPRSGTDEYEIIIEYSLKVDEDCESLKTYTCSASFEIDGEVSGVNALSGVSFEGINLITGFEVGGSCREKPITLPLEFTIDAQTYLRENCAGDVDVSLFFCDSDQQFVPYEDVAANFSAGILFYSEFPINAQSIEYTVANPFPLLAGTHIYYAVLEGSEECYLLVEITKSDFTIRTAMVSDYNGFGVSCSGSADGEALVQVDEGTGPFSYLWSDPNQSTTAAVTGLAAGEFTVTVTDANGCEITSNVTITGPNEDETVIIASSDQMIGDAFYIDTDIEFSFDGLDDIIAIEWDFGNGFNSLEENPTHIFSETGEYQVQLTVTKLNGCQSVFSKIISVVSEEVLEIPDYFFIMPEAFTPNGDGINDFYYPKFNRISGIEFLIFNKWGETIFASSELNSRGWDGTVKGKDAPAGNYVYKVIFTTDNEERVDKSGVFLLIR